LIYDGGGGLQAFELMIDHVTTKSSCFIIESMGYPQAGRGYRTLRALVRRTKQEVVCLRQTEEDAPLPAPITRVTSGSRYGRT
jgi:hypothetical protein